MPSHTPKERRKRRTLGAAAGAMSRGGRELAEITGDPADIKTRPKVGPARTRLSDLVRGFRRL